MCPGKHGREQGNPTNMASPPWQLTANTHSKYTPGTPLTKYRPECPTSSLHCLSFTDRQTHRQSDTDTDRHRDRHTDTQTDTQTDTHGQTQTDRQQANKQTKQTNKQNKQNKKT